jgi:hypothetical protein
MVVIMIRRFVRTDREPEFLASYDAQKPTSTGHCREAPYLSSIGRPVRKGLFLPF